MKGKPEISGMLLLGLCLCIGIGIVTVSGQIVPWEMDESGSIEISGGEADAATWQNNYGGDKRDFGYSIDGTGGAYIVGATTESQSNGFQASLIRINAYGGLLWQKDFGGVGNEQGTSVQRTKDNWFVLAGTSTLPGQKSQVFLVKTDGRGELIWQKKYGNATLNDTAWEVRQTSDGGYIIV